MQAASSGPRFTLSMNQLLGKLKSGGFRLMVLISDCAGLWKLLSYLFIALPAI
jgi:hypothetical protein